MKHGEVYLVAGGVYSSKPRPILVAQNERLNTGDSIIVIPFTSVKNTEIVFRVKVIPSQVNGLDRLCYLEVDKISAINSAYISDMIGVLEAEYLIEVQKFITALLF